MQVVPVLDLMGGQVVRAAGGRREDYRPLSGSRLVASSEPAAVASAFREHLGVEAVYVADLDAIAGAAPDFSAYRAIARLGLRPWIDGGVRRAAAARRIRESGAHIVVAGLETLPSPDVLTAMVEVVGSDSLCFSLDLRDGWPIISASAWSELDAVGIALKAADAGVQRMIVLDLARVGSDSGTGTVSLCKTVHEKRPDVALFAGGGICTIDDLAVLRQAGVVGALVGTALHDGRIGRADIDRVARDATD